MPAFSEMPWGTILGHIQTGTCLNIVSSGVFGFRGCCFFACVLLLQERLCAGTRGNYMTWINAQIYCWPCKYRRKAEAWDQCR